MDLNAQYAAGISTRSQAAILHVFYIHSTNPILLPQHECAKCGRSYLFPDQDLFQLSGAECLQICKGLA